MQHVIEAVAAAMLALPVGAEQRAPSPPPTRPVVVYVDDRGFAWGDCGIGAAAGFGGALVLVGAFALSWPSRIEHEHQRKGERL
jgi:hypothetical protein